MPFQPLTNAPLIDGQATQNHRRLRAKAYRQFEPSARSTGLSIINKALAALILVAAAVAVVETEPAISSGNERTFRLLEIGFGSLFLLEYLIRLWIAPENPRFKSSRVPRLRYALTPAAIIDIVAIIPALLAMGGGGTLLLRFFRILRMLRLAKLGRMSRAWQHIRYAVRSRSFELALTLAIGAFIMLFSATLMYWAEGEIQPDKFGSIPRSLWWSIVTLTTVGYGDVFPMTALGRTVAAFSAVAGIGLIAMPTGILAAAFSEAIQRHRAGENVETL